MCLVMQEWVIAIGVGSDLMLLLHIYESACEPMAYLESIKTPINAKAAKLCSLIAT